MTDSVETSTNQIDPQITLGRQLATELTDVLRKLKGLNGIGERAISEAMNELPDALQLLDKFSAVQFGRGYGVSSIFASYDLRHRPSEEYPDGEIEEDQALAILLHNEVIFTNEHHWMETWPDDARRTTYLGVICNDVFAWGCADAEAISRHQIAELFNYWEKDSCYGPAIWCTIQRKQLPQGPVLRRIEKGGIWNIEELTKEHSLRANHYDGISATYAQLKRDTYTKWCESRGVEPSSSGSEWWNGWKEYTDAHPDWYNDEWKGREAAALAQWRSEHGYGYLNTPATE